MDYPFLSKFWMFIAKKYSTFNEFIFFSEYSVLLNNNGTEEQLTLLHRAIIIAVTYLEGQEPRPHPFSNA